VRTECLACGSQGGFWTRKARRDVWRCPVCALVWIPDGLALDDAGASIYEGDTPIFLRDGNEQYYLDETNLASGGHKLAWVRRHLPDGKRLLDAGANFGHFLSLARDHYEASGVEISAAAVTWSREHLGVDNHVGSIESLPSERTGPYDAVTLWDVIEHVADPEKVLASLRDVLRPGGLLFLSTPDTGSRVARLMRAKWHYLDPVQHIVLFDRANIGVVLRKAGFEVVEMRTFGHYYRVGYVLDRLAYLHKGAALGAVASALSRLLGRRRGKLQLYLNLRDVVGVLARAG
jgi:SAM-dependent methyltransferase